jgi:multidrug transporter EmrE-like cation transporter
MSYSRREPYYITASGLFEIAFVPILKVKKMALSSWQFLIYFSQAILAFEAPRD